MMTACGPKRRDVFWRLTVAFGEQRTCAAEARGTATRGIGLAARRVIVRRDLLAGAGKMRRREFIALLAGATAAWPFGVRAQKRERPRRLGVLMSNAESDPLGQARIAALRGTRVTRSRRRAAEAAPVAPADSII
jgi:hypothetical protein